MNKRNNSLEVSGTGLEGIGVGLSRLGVILAERR